MGRRIRIAYQGAVYHVYARGNDREPIYLQDRDRFKFLEYMDRTASGYGFIYHSYCLMDNHYHLLVETPEANISEGMHFLGTCYARYFNWEHDHVGHVFQDRFNSIVVQREVYLLELCRYIVLNPVRSSDKLAPQDHRWSSYREISGMGQPPSRTTTTSWILSHFGDEIEEAREAYTSFVSEGIGSKSPFEDVLGRTILGNRDFIQDIRDKVLMKLCLGDIPVSQRDAFRPSLEEYFAGGLMRSKKERNELIRGACSDLMYTQIEVAKYLDLSHAAVSRVLSKVAK